MKIRIGWLIAALVVLVSTALGHAESFSPGTGYRVEWDTAAGKGGRPRIAGYVYNDRENRMENVRLRIERVGAPSPASWGYVSGAIPPGGRRYFEATPPDGDGPYRVSVESFDAACGDG